MDGWGGGGGVAVRLRHGQVGKALPPCRKQGGVGVWKACWQASHRMLMRQAVRHPNLRCCWHALDRH